MTLTDPTTAEAEATGNGHAPKPDPGHHPESPKSYVEIWKPPTDDLKGYFNVTVVDHKGIAPNDIIKETTPFKIHFEIWLYGDIWKCVTGDFCYDVFFERANDGARYALSDLVDDDLIQPFQGCYVYKDGVAHLSYWVEVPAGKLPVDGLKTPVYDWTGVVAFRDPCGNRGVLAGHDKGHLQVYAH